MPPMINKATIMSSGSIMALYVETILQIYITLSYSNGNMAKNTEAIISLCSIGLAFLATSTVSYISAESSAPFEDGNGDNNFKSRVLFRFLHIFQFGLLWWIYKIITYYDGSDAILLTNLRLAHVPIQSLPYIIIYSSTFLIKGKLSAIQSLSLFVSIFSTASAVTCYNLRLKLYTDKSEEEETGSFKNSGKFKSTCAVLATFIGTLLVLASRMASITLMTAQIHLWVLVPLSVHFILILVVFILFSSRTSKCTSKIFTITTHSLYCFGMSLLNTFDLVYDNISHVMCKYVAFYSLLLIENIIFISFWLLEFDFNYASKLVIVLGILSAFIFGLIIKFAGCTFSISQSKTSKIEENSSHGTTGMPSITTTITSATLNLGNSPPMNKDDDLISIVQASLAHRFYLTEQINNNVDQSSSINQHIQLDVSGLSRPLERRSTGRKHKHKYPKDKAKTLTKSRERERITSTNDIVRSPHSVQILENTPSAINAHQIKPERSKIPSNNSISIDQNDSFQHSSVLSVSDPETLLSDMMYDEVGGDVCCHMPDEALHKNIFKNKKRIKGVHSNRQDLSKLQGSHEFNHPERIRTIHNLNHQSFLPHHKSSSVSKSQPSTFINTIPSNKLLNENGKLDRLHLKENQYGDYTNKNNDSSDNAVSSAKTYPRNSKFDREMNNILSSIAATDGQNQNTHTLNQSTLHYRFSDSEAVVKNNIKPGRFHSSNNKDKRIYKNIITYTEPDDMTMNSTITSNANTNTDSRHNVKKSDSNVKIMSSNKPTETKGDKIHREDYGKNSKGPVPPRIIASNAIQLCESGSSSFTTTVTHGNISQSGSSSSTTSMTTDDCWQDDRGQSSDAKSDRLSQFLMQSDTDRIPPSENILRWLSTTEASDNIEHV